MKLIFDTNVLVAAFATHGICSSLFEYTLKDSEIIISEYILDELHRILIKKFKMPKKNASDIRSFLLESCKLSDYTIPINQISRDINDDPILGIIDKNNIDFLITGDKDLLVLQKYKNVPIITPRQLWNVFREID